MTLNSSQDDALISSGRTGKRVAIVGAGLGGLSAGIALQKAGFDVTLYERYNVVAGVGGAITLNAAVLHILRGYGIDVDDVVPVKTSRFKSHKGRQRVLWRVEPELLDEAGFSGWIAGMMRSEVYDRLLAVIADGTIVTGKEFTRFEQFDDQVTLHFSDGSTATSDLLIGSDGIDSSVRQQMFGAGPANHLGIAVSLGWCEAEGLDRDAMVCRHSDRYQLGYAPMRYRGRDCFEWWFVEAFAEGQRPPIDLKQHVIERVADFEGPVRQIVEATDPDHGVFHWVVKYRKPLKTWTQGRVTLLGDACHPTSPYAGYGAGMAIEDGYFLGQYLRGANLADLTQLHSGIRQYENQRLPYTNNVTTFARMIGRTFHGLPKPARIVRDLLLDHTSIPDRQISKGYTKDAQILLRSLLDAEAAGTQIK